MAVDMFLKLDGIKGEAQDEKHKTEIDVYSWSWGGNQQATGHVGGGSGAGKIAFEDLHITKRMDVSTPKLMEFLASGKHITKAILTLRKAGDKPLEFLKMTMTNVLISNLSLSGHEGDARSMESLSLNFSTVAIEYQEQKPDGNSAGTTPFSWDIAANKKL